MERWEFSLEQSSHSCFGFPAHPSSQHTLVINNSLDNIGSSFPDYLQLSEFFQSIHLGHNNYRARYLRGRSNMKWHLSDLVLAFSLQVEKDLLISKSLNFCIIFLWILNSHSVASCFDFYLIDIPIWVLGFNWWCDFIIFLFLYNHILLI